MGENTDLQLLLIMIAGLDGSSGQSQFEEVVRDSPHHTVDTLLAISSSHASRSLKEWAAGKLTDEQVVDKADQLTAPIAFKGLFFVARPTVLEHLFNLFLALKPPLFALTACLSEPKVERLCLEALCLRTDLDEGAVRALLSRPEYRERIPWVQEIEKLPTQVVARLRVSAENNAQCCSFLGRELRENKLKLDEVIELALGEDELGIAATTYLRRSRLGLASEDQLRKLALGAQHGKRVFEILFVLQLLSRRRKLKDALQAIRSFLTQASVPVSDDPIKALYERYPEVQILRSGLIKRSELLAAQIHPLLTDLESLRSWMELIRLAPTVRTEKCVRIFFYLRSKFEPGSLEQALLLDAIEESDISWMPSDLVWLLLPILTNALVKRGMGWILIKQWSVDQIVEIYKRWPEPFEAHAEGLWKLRRKDRNFLVAISVHPDSPEYLRTKAAELLEPAA